MKVQAIIPTAGLGRRMNSSTPKPFFLLNEKPLIIYTLQAIQKSNLVDSIILVVQRKYIRVFELLISRYRIKRVEKIIPGGETRCQSVYNGLLNADEDTDIILVHDGARPFIKVKIIDQAIKACQKYSAAVVAVPVKSTIKQVNLKTQNVEKTLDRSLLWEVQTPQVIKKDLFQKAYSRIKKFDLTDDAAVVETIGVKAKVVLGDYQNIKITTQEDLIFAQLLLRG